MNTNLVLQYIDDFNYKVWYDNGHYEGEFSTIEDGYYYWWPDITNTGCLSEENLFDLAQNLRALNNEWNNIIQNDTKIHIDA